MLSKLRAPSRALVSRASRQASSTSHGARTLALTRASCAGLFRIAPIPGHSASRRSFAETHEFKAETRKLLDIVAKSLYTDKEVFIRELISNASDACEKFRFLQTSGQLQEIVDPDAELRIKIECDETARTVSVEDSGIGMTREQVIDQLGTIAKSGSLEFLQSDAVGAGGDADKIIGQFGVGFYSAFVVADKVQVYTKSADKTKDSPGLLWESDGMGSFQVSEADDIPRGTKIIIHLKDDAVEFAKTATVKKSAEKFSSFVDFPIKMVEDKEEKELNKQEALWLKTSATTDEHQAFFRYLNNSSYGDPYYSLMYHTDAPLSIKSCLYIPEDAPSRFFSRDPEVGVSLHSRRVLVKKSADGIIPKWLHWVKGVVDCEDMPMNISRESMQDTRLMEKLSLAVVRRLLRFLGTQAKKDPEKFSKFCKNYSYYLKAGVIEDKEQNHSRHRDDLLKLLRFECSKKDSGELISLEEYIEMAKEGQQNIYYFCCPDRKTGMSSPFMEQFIQRDRNILLLYEDIDEFLVNSMEHFKDKKLVSIDAAENQHELDLDKVDKPEDKDKRSLNKEQQEEIKKFMKDVLKERVQEVKFSDRLVSSPAVVTSILTPHMRKMMKGLMQGREQDGMSNVPVTLELSADHHILTTLHAIRSNNETVARMAVEQLFDNACIAAGVLDEPRTLLDRLNKVVEMLIYQGAGFDYATNEYIARPAPAATETSTETPAADEPKGFVDESAKTESKTESKDEQKMKA
eukprot:gnl/MRDRNA2_/MRDRNA2_30002_c0_seq1.p1 gnl/MRDRNA2_/MRDRNA2_30002_c0~~gnl/MRDRNA2_/MRDRNA2_30002_c0_seq1.p1  ORF type:complete len:745 (-),score=179.14 gnl/MRDRNA2_/MRDRNA2_30002_c0_seq1:81-2315(-)